jgi:hypothetical protein
MRLERYSNKLDKQTEAAMLLTVMESDKASRPLLVASWTWIGLDDVHECGAAPAAAIMFTIITMAVTIMTRRDLLLAGVARVVPPMTLSTVMLQSRWRKMQRAADDSEHRDASESMAQDAESRR